MEDCDLGSGDGGAEGDAGMGSKRAERLLALSIVHVELYEFCLCKATVTGCDATLFKVLLR